MRRLPTLAASITTFALVAGSAQAGESVCDTMISQADLPYVIGTPGRYCFAGNLNYAATTTQAILIWADNVTLDLRGYQLEGRGAGSATYTPGVSVVERGHVTIRNGTIRGFHYGVIFNDGPRNLNNTIEDLQILDSAYTALYVGWGSSHVIRRVRVDNTGGSTWSDAGYGSTAGYGGRGIDLKATNTVITDCVVTRTLSGTAAGWKRSSGIRTHAAGLIVNTQVVGDGTADSTCFNLGPGTIYKDNVASACATPYVGGTPVGTTNHP